MSVCHGVPLGLEPLIKASSFTWVNQAPAVSQLFSIDEREKESKKERENDRDRDRPSARWRSGEREHSIGWSHHFSGDMQIVTFLLQGLHSSCELDTPCRPLLISFHCAAFLPFEHPPQPHRWKPFMETHEYRFFFFFFLW